MTPIQTELTTGPLAAEVAPFLAVGNLIPVAEILNRADIPATKVCQARKAKTVLLVAGLWGNIKVAANTPAHPVYPAALAAYEIGQDPDGEFDFADPKAKPMLDALEAATLITPAARLEIEALCRTTISRAQQVFGRDIAWTELVQP